MSTEIKMPNLSQTTDEVKLLRWLVKEDDNVNKGDLLCEVETDKVNMEVESFASGTVLKLIGKPGDQVKTGTAIVILGQKGEKPSSDNSSGNQDIKDNDIKISEKIEGEINTKKNNSIRATKLVQRIADKENIDLSKIKGSGPRGTIVKDDLKKYINQQKEESSIETKKEQHVYDLTPNQQAVSINNIESKNKIPHFYLKTTVIADSILENKEKQKKNRETSISMYSYFIYAAVKALKEFPKLNGLFKNNKIFWDESINVGFAVAHEEELYVPVLKETGRKDIFEIDNAVKELLAKVRNKKLGPADVSGGTITLTNLGVYDIDDFYGIINFPQAVLLAIGKISKILHIDENNNMSIKNSLKLSGSFDHRIANGAVAALFINKVKEVIEKEISTL